MKEVLLMSDGVIPLSKGVPDEAGRTPLHSAGSMLRKAREAAGLHVAALAVSMKVPVKKLEALESDRLDLLPDVVFVRALASSMCRTLKIDPAPVLERLPSAGKPQLMSAERDINMPFDAYASSAALSFCSVLKKPVVLLVLCLLLAAAGVLFFPELQKRGVAHDTVIAPTVDSLESSLPVVSLPQDLAVPLAQTVGVPGPGELTLAADSPPPEINTPILAQNSVPTGSGTPQAGVAVSANPAVQPDNAVETPVVSGAASGILVLKAKAPCWVKIVDAKGTVQVQRVIAAGETAGVGGVAPLSVVIGAADAMDVLVNGKPFSMVGLTKDNVARFEVRQ